MVDGALAFRTSYHGAHFSGSQSQKNKNGVQDYLEAALKTLWRQKVRVNFTSRTDAGVHARDQVFFLRAGQKQLEDMAEPMQRRFLYALNSLVPAKMAVWELGVLKKDFNPKEHVLWKEYRYKLFVSATRDPLMDEQSWWIKRPLQEDRLREALAAFEGEHDFRYLAKSRSIQQLSSTRRRILSVECLRRRHLYLNSASYFEIRIKGEGFLHQMVRRMVGFAVDFASGEDLSVLEILNPNKRTDLGRNSYSVAPAQALCLHRTSIEKNWYSPILNP